ncbi:MAG: hypothetical protein KI786_10825 [Mameliella sp.]|nr:hypothetical protein [Phaeodactylibacter sp.]NRA48522.1 hypothetical protein [Phaeodactylibacter sp.]
MRWKDIDIKEEAEKFRCTLVSFPTSAQFIIRERVWEGFWKYGWFSKALTFVAILVGLNMVANAFEYFESFQNGEYAVSISGVTSFAQTLFDSSLGFLTDSGSRFLMLVLLEVIIFHASREALRIIAGKDSKSDFGDFFNAQVRMLIVGGYAWLLTLIAALPVKIFFGIFEFLDFLKPAFLFFIEAFFLGFTIVDNYHEQYGLNISKSFKLAKENIGINLGIGLVVRVLFWVPVMGPLIAPLIAAVAATIVMHEECNLSDAEEIEPSPLNTATKSGA